jgi:hypothetical protein
VFFSTPLIFRDHLPLTLGVALGLLCWGIVLGLRCLGIALGLRCGGHWFGTELPRVKCLVYFFKLISQLRKKTAQKIKKTIL